MEPLLPTAEAGRLCELTCDILRESGRLTGQVHSPHVLRAAADLVREMNCYYSNLIEGHKTTPRDIERALRQDFSSDQTRRRNQQLGLAHLAVGRLMEDRLADPSIDAYDPAFLCWLHREFYEHLPAELHEARTIRGAATSTEAATSPTPLSPPSAFSSSRPCSTRFVSWADCSTCPPCAPAWNAISSSKPSRSAANANPSCAARPTLPARTPPGSLRKNRRLHHHRSQHRRGQKLEGVGLLHGRGLEAVKALSAPFLANPSR